MQEVWAKIRYLLGWESHPRDLDEELEAHLQMEIEANIERGMSPDEARAVARREFGNPARVRESAQEAWVFPWLDSILQDVHYGLRQFRRAPGLFLAVVVSLAIGLGANIAIFSLIDAAVLRPLPVADPDRLIQLEWRNDRMPAGAGTLGRGVPQTDGGVRGVVVSEPVFRAFAEEQTAFLSLIGIGGIPNEVSISVPAGVLADQARRLYVSRNFFEGLGVPPVLGRAFVEEEDRPGAEPTIVVSHRFWSSRLGGDPDAIGRVLRINDEPARIVGVSPPGFFGPFRGQWIDVYQPLATHPFNQAPGFPAATYWQVSVMTRLAPGVPGSAATAAMTPLFRNLVAETTGTEIEQGLELIARPAGHGLDWSPVRVVSQALWILMLLVGVLLLLVCANVANLLLSRSETRRRESAVRLALGAGRRRLIRQHLVESGMVAVIGGATGLVLGHVLARAIYALFQTGHVFAIDLAIMLNWRVAAYAAAVSMLTALAFGLAPAWTAARSGVNDALKTQSRSVLGGGLRLPKLLVSVQFALSFVALVAAGLLGRSLANLYATDLGFDGGQLSYATVHPGRVGADPDSFLDRLEQEIAAIPGVLAVAPLERRPLDGGAGGSYVSAPGGPPATLAEGIGNPEARASMVQGGPGFIEVLGIPLLAGRTLDARDHCSVGPAAAPGSEAGASGMVCPVVVDERFAEVFFPGGPPVGQRFEMPGITLFGSRLNYYEVVGLVANARLGYLRDEEALPAMYWLGPAGFPRRHLAIRAQIDSGALAAAVQQAVTRADPAVPLSEFHTQSELIDRMLGTERLLALASGAFSLAALALAAVGLGGLLAYAVARRTNEIGIRMALGATGAEIERMVLGDSLRMVALGVLIGVPAAYAVGRYLASLLFGLEPIDPLTASGALVALTAIAGMAALLPARRAARINPLTALRDE